MKHLIKKILNEFDENDLSWAEDAINEKNLPVSYDNVQPGDKVVRGINWDYEDDQDNGAEYGEVTEEYDDNPVEGKPYLGYAGHDNNRFSGYWVRVEWFDSNGKYVNSNSYRVGPRNYDLSYYKPTENL